jgi:hypothetical protein
LAACAAWLAPLRPTPAVWALRLAAPVFAAALVSVLHFALPADGQAPDLLARVTPNYFERGGLSFAPRFVTDGGSCYLCLYFQNRFAGHASARLELRPPQGWFGLSPAAVAGMTVSLECPGGAFGVAWMQYGVPRSEQGKSVAFHVAANVGYPGGRGRRLCASRGTTGGPLRGDRPGASRAWILLPTNVPEVMPARVEVQTSLLTNPDLSTGGFEVLPAKAAA